MERPSRLRWPTAIAILLVTLLTACPAKAVEYTTKYISPGSPCVVSGVEFRCYDIEQYKGLLILDSRLAAAESTLVLNKDQIDALQAALDAKDAQVVLLKEDLEGLQKIADEAHDAANDFADDVKDAESHADMMKWIAIGSSVGAFLVGIITGVLVLERLR